jgi:hypothetical protein
MRLQPLAAVPLDDDPFDSGPASAKCIKLPDALFCQNDMPPFSALAGPDMHCPGIGVEVADTEISKFAEASAGRECPPNEGPELGLGGVD